MDRLAFGVKRFFFETKSWRLFSFLFGLGFSFQLLSARRQQQPFAARYLRRTIGLVIIGAVHTLHRFGPAEWAWRAMTYLQLPQMRARPSSIEGGAG